jgi:H+/Cl- antiporter ClcA
MAQPTAPPRAPENINTDLNILGISKIVGAIVGLCAVAPKIISSLNTGWQVRNLQEHQCCMLFYIVTLSEQGLYTISKTAYQIPEGAIVTLIISNLNRPHKIIHGN